MNPLQAQLRSLKLSGMAEHLDLRLMEAQRQQLALSEFLSMLLSDETDRRNQRRLQRLLKQANLTQDQTLERFDFNVNPSIQPMLIRELATCRFIEQGLNVFFIGPTGTGKTHLAKALAHCACRKYLSVRFYSFHQFFDLLAQADLAGTLSPLLQALFKTDLIVIDDFAFKKLGQQASEHFYALVNARYPSKPFLFTSNRPLSDWPAIFPDPIIANTILDRLAHNAYQITIKGESYRKNLRPKPLDP